MDIRSGAKYPAGALSNFSPYVFYVDNVRCNSMEGFLQSLKFSNIDMQVHVCTLTGKAAKFKGSKKNWQRTQTLYWNGISYKRNSTEYQDLLDKAFSCLAKNIKFKKALLSTKGATLNHSIGKKSIRSTVLTQQEFCSRLMKIREVLI